MKLFIATVLAATLLVCAKADFKDLPEELRKQIIEITKTCMDENPDFDPSKYKEDGKMTSFPDDQPFKDYLFCIAQKKGSMNDDGSFNTEFLKETMNKFHEGEDIDGIIDECTATDRGNGPDNAWEMFGCLKDKLPMFKKEGM